MPRATREAVAIDTPACSAICFKVGAPLFIGTPATASLLQTFAVSYSLVGPRCKRPRPPPGTPAMLAHPRRTGHDRAPRQASGDRWHPAHLAQRRGPLLPAPAERLGRPPG